ncbi:MAG: hypothetical protein L3J65_01805 [Robiginitomaculum sp.]|nr:hypothetical protein [Robiginitomaculum sp.]
MKNLIIKITLGLILTACGSSDSPPEKQMTTKELAAAAAAGDKDAMRELEQQVAKKAKAETKKMATAANDGHHGAMYKLAVRYQYGHDMDKDLTAAKSWLKKSAAAGNRAAKDALKNWKE